MKVNHITLDHKHQHDERPQLSIENDFSTKAKKKKKPSQNRYQERKL